MIKKNIGKINGIDYKEYIFSPEWKEKRIAVAQREDHVCHKTYARFGHEDLNVKPATRSCTARKTKRTG
jgi:hypothetical protein